ncbi:MAG: 1-acyl-sn-glycerol-3-phosphate acyltransferase [Planctomycetes bacterium]|nr:1-acyl-sn-glycerol-3-phosphate acyltransferase [Planctomycetota bacterium]
MSRSRLVVLFAFAYSALLFALLAPLAALWPTLGWRNRLSLLAGHLAARACLALAGIKVVLASGREHLAQRPAVFLFNHTNTLDFFVNGILARPGWLVFGKRENAWLPFIGWGWAMGGHPLIARGDRGHWAGVLARVEDLLRRGWCTIIAPEGTRNRDGQVGEFKKGAFHLALAAGVPLVPIVIRGAAPLFDATGPLPGTIVVDVLPPVPTAGWAPDRLDEHVAAVRGLYLAALGDPAAHLGPAAGQG